MTILEEAAAIVDGARQNDYGHPEDNFEAIAGLWRAYFAAHQVMPGKQLTGKDVAHMMILLKIARNVTKSTRDNCVDMAGYARCLEMIGCAQ